MASSRDVEQALTAEGAALERAKALQTVGVVGLGRVGQAFAANLIADGHRVSVFDRDTAKARECAGAAVETELAALADCDIIFSSLPGDEQ
jgi:3-hydroxyisobutyrate dehydrogenase-like beta-hydroxyacid dehydrogenase